MCTVCFYAISSSTGTIKSKENQLIANVRMYDDDEEEQQP